VDEPLFLFETTEKDSMDRSLSVKVKRKKEAKQKQAYRPLGIKIR
jgi:hypothetical protein